MQTCKPIRDQLVPSHSHRKTGDPGKYVTGCSQQTQLEQKNRRNRKEAANAAIAQGDANGLRNGSDKVNVAALAKSNHRAGTENEHGTNNGRGDPYRMPNAPHSVLAFTRQDRDILEAAERTKNHLTKERKRAQVVGGKFK